MINYAVWLKMTLFMLVLDDVVFIRKYTTCAKPALCKFLLPHYICEITGLIPFLRHDTCLGQKICKKNTSVEWNSLCSKLIYSSVDNHLDTVDMYIRTAAIIIKTVVCSSLILSILSTHNFTLLQLCTVMILYNPDIWCQPGEDGFLMSSTQGFFLMLEIFLFLPHLGRFSLPMSPLTCSIGI